MATLSLVQFASELVLTWFWFCRVTVIRIDASVHGFGHYCFGLEDPHNPSSTVVTDLLQCQH